MGMYGEWVRISPEELERAKGDPQWAMDLGELDDVDQDKDVADQVCTRPTRPGTPGTICSSARDSPSPSSSASRSWMTRTQTPIWAT
jgi:hypothetical protein